MHDKKFHTTSDHTAALRRRAGCGDAHDGAHRGAVCAAIDELIAFAPVPYANAAIAFIV